MPPRVHEELYARSHLDCQISLTRSTVENSARVLMTIGWTPVHPIDSCYIEALPSNAHGTATSPAKNKLAGT